MGEAVHEPDVQVVGNAFVLQYYHVLHHSPEHVHRFYQDNSKMGRPLSDGVMTEISTLQAIKEKILSLDYGEFRAEIKTVDAQESFGGGVLVLVTGYLTGKDEVTRNFTQVFFLAPQEKGYFVLNDAFRYVEDVKSQGAHIPVSETENHPSQDKPSQETPVRENTTVMEEETSEELLVSVSHSKSPEMPPEEPIAKIVHEAHEIIQSSPEPGKAEKEIQKKSYACMVKVPAVETIANGVPAAAKDVSKTVAKQVKVVSAPADTTTFSKDAVENGHEHEPGHSIYIKALPLDATPSQIEAEFKQFGPIKRGGVQVRSSKGFCYGFVEFEDSSSAVKALKTSTIMISDHEVFIQEKTSTNSGVNNKQRYPARRGNGFKNEDNQGRGSNRGGRGGYGRNDFTNSDQNGKGNNQQGFHNRGTPNGYRRYDNGNGSIHQIRRTTSP